MAFMANTLVFVLTGVIISLTTFNVDFSDWMIGLAIYIGCHFIRMTSFLVLLPALRQCPLPPAACVRKGGEKG